MDKIGVITSGGDCGGLNAVVKGIATAARGMGIASYVIPNGYAGLYNLVNLDSLVELTPERLLSVDATLAGSEAGHSRVKVSKISDPDKYARIKEGLRKFSLDGLVISGGDDTGSVILDLAKHDIKCVHAPKTMDLDLQTYSVGGDSTINRIANFARDVRTTGRTHNRVIVIEVFGRYAGHTAFRGGIAAEADAILIPEIAVDFDVLYSHVKDRYFHRIDSSDVRAGTYLIIVAEGLKDATGKEIVDETAPPDPFGHKKLAGAGKYVCNELNRRLKEDAGVKDLMRQYGLFVETLNEVPEIRPVTPGHLVRCGQTLAYDVSFGIEAGAAAVHLLANGICGVTVVGVYGQSVRYMKTEQAIQQRYVDLDQVSFHESLGICFGRDPGQLALSYLETDVAPERHL